MYGLEKLTGKKYNCLVNRGNTAIKLALKIIDRPITLIQDQGGWLTYKTYPKKVIELKTNLGILDLKDLKEKANKDSVLLINSLAGYAFPQPMEEIERICKEKGCKIINDASGSIGTDIAKIGDIILASFGHWKPIDLGSGGLISSNSPLDIKENFDKTKIKELENKIKSLPKRLTELHSLVKKVKEDLKNFKILNKEDGLVVLTEKNDKIIDYCNKNNLQYTLCPRYIRINKEAISIETKRKI